MVVTDDQVQTALEYLSADPPPLAEAQFRLAKAENACERRAAEVIENQPEKMAMERRKARVRLDNEWGDLRYHQEQAAFDVVTEKERIRGAEAIIAVWRTQNANARVAERVW